MIWPPTEFSTFCPSSYKPNEDSKIHPDRWRSVVLTELPIALIGVLPSIAALLLDHR